MGGCLEWEEREVGEDGERASEEGEVGNCMSRMYVRALSSKHDRVAVIIFVISIK